jgi:hypothetical protein
MPLGDIVTAAEYSGYTPQYSYPQYDPSSITIIPVNQPIGSLPGLPGVTGINGPVGGTTATPGNSNSTPGTGTDGIMKIPGVIAGAVSNAGTDFTTGFTQALTTSGKALAWYLFFIVVIAGLLFIFVTGGTANPVTTIIEVPKKIEEGQHERREKDTKRTESRVRNIAAKNKLRKAQAKAFAAGVAVPL